MLCNWRRSLLCLLGCVASVGRLTHAMAQEPQSEHAEKENEGGLAGFPIVAFSPETNLLFGGVALYQFDVGRNATADFDAHTLRSPPRKSSLNAIAIYTLKGQLAFSLAPTLYLNGETWIVSASLQGSVFPDRLYEPGQNSPDEFENYSQQIFAGSIGAERQIISALRIGGGVRIAHAQITEIEAGGLLDQEQVPGHQGGLLIGVGPTIAWDDRDKDTATASGGRHELTLALLPEALGSDFGFAQLAIRSRHFFSLGHEQVLALELFSDLSVGNVPFQMMSTLGGENRMRGYYAGRYRDLNQLVIQAEYRVPLFWRMGAVAFAGAGNVPRRLSDFRLQDPKASGGLGLRLALSPEERVNLRVDFAVTRESESNLYVGLSEAF